MTTERLALRTEATNLIARAITHYGFSEVTVDAQNSTTLHATLRSPNTSRIFVATIRVTEAQEL